MTDKEIKELGNKILEKYFKKDTPNDNAGLRCAICKQIRKDTTTESINGKTKQVCTVCLIKLKIKWEAINDGFSIIDGKWYKDEVGKNWHKKDCVGKYCGSKITEDYPVQKYTKKSGVKVKAHTREEGKKSEKKLILEKKLEDLYNEIVYYSGTVEQAIKKGKLLNEIYKILRDNYNYAEGKNVSFLGRLYQGHNTKISLLNSEMDRKAYKELVGGIKRSYNKHMSNYIYEVNGKRYLTSTLSALRKLLKEEKGK